MVDFALHSSVLLAKLRWRLQVQEISPKRPERLWDHPVGNRSLSSGAKQPGREVDHTPPPSAEVKERIELYLYSPSGPSWPVLGWSLPLHSQGFFLGGKAAGAWISMYFEVKNDWSYTRTPLKRGQKTLYNLRLEYMQNGGENLTL